MFGLPQTGSPENKWEGGEGLEKFCVPSGPTESCFTIQEMADVRTTSLSFSVLTNISFQFLTSCSVLIPSLLILKVGFKPSIALENLIYFIYNILLTFVSIQTGSVTV
jgi:hypothetical protein